MLASTLSSFAPSLAALAAVLALIWLARWLAPSLLRLRDEPIAARGLALEQSLALDARRRLHLVRCTGRQVLLLTGGAQDVVVGWLDRGGPGSAPPPPATAARAESGGTGMRLLPIVLIAVLVPATAHAQSFSLDLGGTAGVGAGAASRLMQLTALLTVLSLAPSLLVMLTAFTRIVIALSLLRSALGVQNTPPNAVLIGLALFVMQPVLDQAWEAGLLPMSQGRVDTLEGMRLAAAPFHRFMSINAKSDDVRLFLDIARLPDPAEPDATPWRVLVPAFLIGELRRGFEMGFLLYLPFLVIDTVVASLLMSLGMMMLPPNVISLPFKLIFFVLVDGWRLTCGSLVQSFGPPT